METIGRRRAARNRAKQPYRDALHAVSSFIGWAWALEGFVACAIAYLAPVSAIGGALNRSADGWRWLVFGVLIALAFDVYGGVRKRAPRLASSWLVMAGWGLWVGLMIFATPLWTVTSHLSPLTFDWSNLWSEVARSDDVALTVFLVLPGFAVAFVTNAVVWVKLMIATRA